MNRFFNLPGVFSVLFIIFIGVAAFTTGNNSVPHYLINEKLVKNDVFMPETLSESEPTTVSVELLSGYILGRNGLTERQQFLGDVNADNEISVADILRILNYQPPEITSSPPLNTEEGDLYLYDIKVGSILPSDFILHDITASPPGMNVNSETGRLSWVPSKSDVGSHKVTVRVTDVYNRSDSQTYKLDVSDPNDSPVITSDPPSSEAEELSLWSHFPAATDPDSDDLTWSLMSAPGGMSIDASTGNISWTPATGQAGEYPVKIRVDDGKGGVDVQSFLLLCTGVNSPPAIISTAPEDAITSTVYTYQAKARDPNPGDILSWTLPMGPEGMKIGYATGLVEWRIPPDAAGEYAIRIRVTDQGGKSDMQFYTLSVQPYNHDPLITSVPPTAVVAGNEYIYQVTAFDADGGHLTFSLEESPSGMNIHPDTGLILWNPGSPDIGRHDVSIKVTDTRSGAAVQDYSLSVNAVGERPYVVSVSPDDGTTNVITNENTITYHFSKAIDPTSIHEDAFLVSYKDWATTDSIPMEYKLTPDLKTLILTVSREYSYTPPKMWSTHVPVPCEPGYFPGSFSNGTVEKTVITASLFENIRSLDGNSLVSFESHFKMFNRFIWTGVNSCTMNMSPNDRYLALHYGPPHGQQELIIINSDINSPDGNTYEHFFDTYVDHFGDKIGWFTPDSRIYYACGYGGNVRRFDMKTMTELPVIPNPDLFPKEEHPRQMMITPDQKRMYIYYDCDNGYYTGNAINLLDVDPLSPTYNDWITTNVAGGIPNDGRHSFTLLPGGKSMYMAFNPPGSPTNVFHQYWGLLDIDPQSPTYHQVTFMKERTGRTYEDVYAISNDGEWLYGHGPGWSTCGSCGYFARKRLVGEDPDDWVDDTVWANCNGYASFGPVPMAGDGRTVYFPAYSDYVLAYDLVSGTYVDADNNPETTQLKPPKWGGAYTDFPEGISLIPIQLYNWWGSKVQETWAPGCVIPKHNKFFYFSGASLLVEAFPMVKNPLTISPEIEILSPPDGSTVSMKSITVTGTLKDNNEDVTVTINGADAEYSQGLFSGSVTLQPGDNFITAVAVDSDGNLSSDTITVTYDSDAPEIEITEPENAEHLRTSPVMVRGTVDDAGITHVILNGCQIPVNGGEFSKQLPLTEGVNLFHATAEDTSGKIASDSVVVHYELNLLPSIVSIPPLSAEEGTIYTYQAEAEDENDDDLIWTLENAPEGMNIDPSTGLIEWTPDGFEVAQVVIIIRVDDGWGGFDIQKYYINVIPSGSDNTPPRVRVLPDTPAPAYGNFVNIVVETEDNIGVTSRSLEINGVAEPLTFNAGTGQWETDVRFFKLGENILRGTAKDASGNLGEDIISVYVWDGKDNNPPNVKFLAPSPDSEITSPTEVWVVIGDDHLLSWKLEYALKGEEQFTVLCEGTEDQIIEKIYNLRPEDFLPGTYILRLSAVDMNYLRSVREQEFSVNRRTTLGYNEYEATDLSVPLMGINIEIARRYNSFYKGQGKFGIGWRLQNLNVDLLRNNQYSLVIRKPDGNHAFFLLDLERVNPFYPQFVQAVYKPFGPTFDTLTFEGEDILFQSDDGTLLTWPDFRDFKPETYYLTTPDNLTYTIEAPAESDQALLKSISDLNGNVLSIRDNGLYHSSGLSVEFEKDELGRITKITDPMDKTILYEYDEAGDLISVTNRRGFQATYTYDSKHNLMSYADPAGVGYVYEYDDTGRVIAMIDGEGNRSEITYDLDQRKEIIYDSEGNPEIVTYNELGHVIERMDALNQVTRYEYNENGLPIKIIDNDGNITLQTWDVRGNLLTKTDPLGNTTSYTYDQRNKMLSMTDPRGFRTSYEYDSRGNQIKKTDPDGYVFSTEYDDNGNKTSETDPLGRVMKYEYDSLGRLIVEDPPGPEKTTYTYDQNGRRTRIEALRTVGENVVQDVTVFEYDAGGNLLKTILPGGTVTEQTFDEGGRILKSIDAKGRTSDHEYDARGLLKKVMHESGHDITYQYDKNGRIKKMGSNMGVQVSAAIDELGRAENITTPDGEIRYIEYDSLGQMKSETDQLGNKSLYDYDTNGNLVATTDTLGNVSTWKYDPSGNMTEYTDPNGNSTKYEYDARNLNTKIIYPDGGAIIYGYDAAGQKTSFTDQNGYTTYYEYDLAGNLIKAEDPLGNIIRYSWDENGNLTGITDAKDNGTSFTYDSQNRLIETRLPEGMTETRTYDETGRLKMKTDFNGHTTTYSYNEYDLLINTLYHDGTTETRTYDGKNNLKTVTNTSGTLTFHYDAMDRITRVTNPMGQNVDYVYDKEGNRIGMNTTFGNTSYDYDDLGRLIEITDHSSARTQLNYDPAGNLTGISRPNGINTTIQYDNLNRLTGMIHKNGADIVESFTYTLGKAGNRTSLVEHNGRTVDYSYDKTYRLKGEAINDPLNGNRNISYSYDPVGNRISKTVDGIVTSYEYDDNDRLLREWISTGGGEKESLQIAKLSSSIWAGKMFSEMGIHLTWLLCFFLFVAMILFLPLLIPQNLVNLRRRKLRILCMAVLLMVGPILFLGADNLQNIHYEAVSKSIPQGQLKLQDEKNYQYDDNGNLIQIQSTAGITQLQYDPADRLRKIISPEGRTSFAYDGMGGRIEKFSSVEGISRYLLDHNTDQKMMPHVQVLAEMDGMNNLRTQYTRAFEMLLRMDQDASESWILHGGDLSTRLLANGSGDITDTWIYDAFGKILHRTGTTKNEFLFAGEQYDANTGYYFLRSRYYQPDAGRFISRDHAPYQAFDPENLHRYVYVNNNPLKYHDPSGEGGTVLEAAITSAIIGGLTAGILKGLTSKSSGLQLVYEILWAAGTGALFGFIGGAAGAAMTGVASNLAFSASSIIWVWGSRAVVACAFATFVATPLALADMYIWGFGSAKETAVSIAIVWLVSFVSFMVGAAVDFKTQNMICDEAVWIIKNNPTRVFHLTEADELAEATLLTISKEFHFMSKLGIYMDTIMPFFQEVLNQIFK